MESQASIVVAIVGLVIVYTGSIISLVLWLASKFASLERTIYSEMEKHRKEDDRRFEHQSQRLQVLELRALGYTMSGEEISGD